MLEVLNESFHIDISPIINLDFLADGSDLLLDFILGGCVYELVLCVADVWGVENKQDLRVNGSVVGLVL